jgi:hypothetical protein
VDDAIDTSKKNLKRKFGPSGRAEEEEHKEEEEETDPVKIKQMKRAQRMAEFSQACANGEYNVCE